MYHHTYTVGLVSALPKELYAIRALFDSRYQDPPVHLDPNDTNSYVFGRVGHHDVVAACLPQGEYGTNSAADVASNMHRSFPALRFCLLVGIGGGVPSRTHDVRLGDVVVSQPTETHSGVVQYDLGKVMEGGSFQAVGVLTRPPRVLMKAISNLTSDPDLPPDFLQDFLHQIAARNPSYQSPGSENDSLHQSDALHSISSNDGLNGCACPLVDRPERNLDYPRIFYGVIASGNQVVKSSTVRDQLGSRHRILCLEMEAAGVMNTMPCLVIRGICDYADAHKNKAWQEYAAATAAAYAKVLLSYVRRLSTSAKYSPETSSNDHAEQDYYSDTERPPSIPASTADAPNSHHLSVQNPVPTTIEQPRPSIPVESERLTERCILSRRRQFWNPWPSDALPVLHSLQDWIGSASGSSLLVCEAACAAAHPRAVDLAVEMVDFLRSTTSQYTVLYGFSSPPFRSQSSRNIDILESLLSQCLSATAVGDIPEPIDRPPDSNDPEVHRHHHHHQHREQKLLERLLTTLARVDQCFLIVEGPDAHSTERLVAALAEIVHHRPVDRSLKAMIVGCIGYQAPRIGRLEKENRLICIKIPPLSSSRRKPGVAKGRAPQWKRLRPSLAAPNAGSLTRLP